MNLVFDISEDGSEILSLFMGETIFGHVTCSLAVTINYIDVFCTNTYNLISLPLILNLYLT